MNNTIFEDFTEVYIVRPKEDLFGPIDSPIPETIKRAIKENAKKYRLPYADWYVKENQEVKERYNKTSEDPDGYIQCISLFDAFRQYVLWTYMHQTTPALKNRTSKPWNSISVDEVAEVLREDSLESNTCLPLDDESLLVEIDKKMDITKIYLFENFDVDKYSVPIWLDFLTQALNEDEEQREERDFKREKVFDWCEDTFKKWRQEQELKKIKKAG